MKKIFYCFAALGVASLIGGAQTAPLGTLPLPQFYGRLVEPSEYPAYARRGFKVPTWKTFGDRPQLVGGRYSAFNANIPAALLTQVPDDADLPGRPWLVGRVYRPDIGILRQKEPVFSESLRQMRASGTYLFNVGGYGPGSPLKGSFGQCFVTPEQNKALTEILGAQFLGFDLGEQDGRYHNSFEDLQLPSPRDREGQHRAFREWCDRVIDDQGGRLTLLTTLWGWHYPAQDGAMGLLGAECHNKYGVTNPQVQYAFLRGAGKQYGLLWYGDVSIFSTFGLSSWSLDDAGNMVAKPGGSSANLMRRTFLSQWLWNSCILGFEGSTVARDKDNKRARLSPIGQVQADTERLIQRGFSPGVMQTPVAILQDYFSGWMPARTNTTQFTAFNSLPYAPGDFLTDNLLSLLFPGYENCGWFMDERGAMAPTPYGDIADCLLSDAPAEILARYSLVLCSGLEHDISGVRERLAAFLASGGTVLAAGDDAARLWPEYCRAAKVTVPAGETIKWTSGAADSETSDFELHEAKAAAKSEVLATCMGRPAVIKIRQGSGTLILALAATGMNRTALPAKAGGHPMWGGENTELERPFLLLNHARRAYDAALSAQRLFSAGDGLAVTTCRRADGTFVVGVSNPSLKRSPFALQSHIGAIATIKEVPLGAPIHALPGYWPHQWSRFFTQPQEHRDDLGELTGENAPSDAARIGGGDMRLFEVTLREPAARQRPDAKPPAPPHNRLLRVPDLVTLRVRLLTWPRFAYYFDGVAIDAQALLDTDTQWLRDNANWFRRHGVRIVVLARGPKPQTALGERLEALGASGELAPPDVRVLAAGTTPRRSGGVQILEGDWRSWDGLFQDVRAAWQVKVPGRIAGPGKSAVVATGQRPAEAARRFIALRDLFDPARAVAARPGLLEKFGGLMLDAAWLDARSRAALARDRAWLASQKLDVAIDFTRAINRFPDYTFSSGVPHRYAASVRFFDAVLEKMPLLGAKNLIIVSHNGAETGDDWNDQRQGIERFLTKANALGLTVHWRPSSRRPPRDLAKHSALVAELQVKFPSLRIAASTVDEPNPEKLLRAVAAAGKPELWLLAAPQAPGTRSGTRFLPIGTLPKDNAAALLATCKGATVVYEADYLSWDEAQKE